MNYNHGQKSWDRFALLALLYIHLMKIQHFHLPSVSLPPPDILCRKLVTTISPEFQKVIVLGGEGEQQRIFKRIALFFFFFFFFELQL